MSIIWRRSRLIVNKEIMIIDKVKKTISKMAEPPKSGVRKVIFLDFRTVVLKLFRLKCIFWKDSREVSSWFNFRVQNQVQVFKEPMIYLELVLKGNLMIQHFKILQNRNVSTVHKNIYESSLWFDLIYSLDDTLCHKINLDMLNKCLHYKLFHLKFTYSVRNLALLDLI